MARADAGPEPSPTTMPLVTNLSTVSLAASKRSTTSASAAEAEQATLRLATEDGGQCFRRGHLGHGRACNCNEGATLGLGMASMDDEGIDEFS